MSIISYVNDVKSVFKAYKDVGNNDLSGLGVT